MRKKLLLFDIDGTLLLTSGAGMRAMKVVTDEMFGEGYGWEGINFAGSLDPVIFGDFISKHELDRHEYRVEHFHDRYIAQLSAELSGDDNGAYTMPGIIELLDVLRRRVLEKGDIVLGLLTGNYTQAGPIKLKAAGIDAGWFELTVYGDEAKTRPGLVDVAMGKYEAIVGEVVEPGDIIVIGDTEHDVSCAHAHGCVAFAVATGMVSAEKLREAGADYVVEDLSDAGELMGLIEG